MRVSATAKYLRASTRKTRLVTEAIKGKPVEEAAALLRFMPQKAAADVARVLKSATANAENNHNLSAQDLIILDAVADEGREDHGRTRPRLDDLLLVALIHLLDPAEKAGLDERALLD